jgi:hypothetical protein
VPLSTVQFWVARTAGQRLDRVDWCDRPTGDQRPANRTTTKVEDQVLKLRCELRDSSALGEFGAQAIHRELSGPVQSSLSVRTIGRILVRRGALDGRRRLRRPPPPRGWFLPVVMARRAEVDSFDIIEDLVIQAGPFLNVLTGISLHGGLCEAWPRVQITAKNTVESLLQHWRAQGLPQYAKFDNDTIFQGAHQWPDSFGRVIRLCLSLRVIPVFAPPREPGFQAEVENFNGRWQAKVWRRFHFQTVSEVRAQSKKFIAASYRRAASRREAAPARRPFPKTWKLDWQLPLRGLVIFIRRTNERGEVSALGHTYLASSTWGQRLVRVEVDLTAGRLRIYALRRREPQQQPLLASHVYTTPHKRFHE